MVGVPGKSKGCSTCRRRKKGCGQERPACRQCISSGHVCGGYERNLTFVLHPASKEVEEAVFLPVRPAPLLALPQSLDRATTLVQCRNIFFDNFLPHGDCVVRDEDILKSNHPSNWVELLPGFQGDDSSLELAFSALSMARMGRNNNDRWLVKESNKVYGKALRSLQKALYDSKRMHSEQVLAACQTLGLYETYEGVGGQSAGWISHAQGAARIIELRGPHAYASHAAHFLLVGSRVPIIYSATVRRKSTFLAEPEWLTIPWTSITRTGMDFLVDIATQVPALLEDLNNVKSTSTSNQTAALLACLSRFQAAQKSLAIWLVYRKTNAVPITTKHEISGDDDVYPFTHRLTFENHLFAGSNLFHWTMNLVVSATIIEILLLLARSGYQALDLPQTISAAEQEARLYATNIIQSVEYCLQSDMGDLGINMINFPTSLAFKFFSTVNETDICSWLVRACSNMNHAGLRLVLEQELSHPSSNSEDNQDETLREGGLVSLQSSQRLIVRSINWKQNKVEAISRNMPVDKSLHSEAIITTAYTEYDEHDLDSHGDTDSTNDAASPKSGISHTSSNSSRGSGSNAVFGVPKDLAQLQMINASKGEFTFVSEDPSNHYIVSEQRKT